jgi:hypothetical protein
LHHTADLTFEPEVETLKSEEYNVARERVDKRKKMVRRWYSEVASRACAGMPPLCLRCPCMYNCTNCLGIRLANKVAARNGKSAETGAIVSRKVVAKLCSEALQLFHMVAICRLGRHRTVWSNAKHLSRIDGSRFTSEMEMFPMGFAKPSATSFWVLSHNAAFSAFWC